MRVLVLGAGVVGVSSAWYLARAGHAVTVVDRQDGVAMETSFANAGQISPGLAGPWAAPGTPAQALRWMFHPHSPMVLRPWADPGMAVWLARFVANCNERAFARNKARMARLADYSRDRLRDLRDMTGISYDGAQRGLLQMFRTQADLDGVSLDTAVLDTLGVPYQVLDRAGCVAQEPALAANAAKIAGGLLLPGDETGDAHLFTQRLAAMAAAAGVRFVTNVAITKLHVEGGELAGVETSKGLMTADRYVVCLGSYAPALLRPIGVRLPVYPVKGYSLTFDVADPERAPLSTVLDDTYKIGITRLGDRIRVGGTAELSGHSLALRPSRRAALEHSVMDLFPGCGDVRLARFWTGLRPMTPDGAPAIGETQVKNLFLNTGHGTLGWTMACGSGALLADLVSERRPNVEYADLSPGRF